MVVRRYDESSGPDAARNGRCMIFSDAFLRETECDTWVVGYFGFTQSVLAWQHCRAAFPGSECSPWSSTFDSLAMPARAKVIARYLD
jgi:hypothetical protein